MAYAVQQEVCNNKPFPQKRAQQNEMIFQEIFVKPK
jgi:hypothetical protein